MKAQVFNICTSSVVTNAWKNGQQVNVYGVCYSLNDGQLKKLVGPINGDEQLAARNAVEYVKQECSSGGKATKVGSWSCRCTTCTVAHAPWHSKADTAMQTPLPEPLPPPPETHTHLPYNAPTTLVPAQPPRPPPWHEASAMPAAYTHYSSLPNTPPHAPTPLLLTSAAPAV